MEAIFAILVSATKKERAYLNYPEVHNGVEADLRVCPSLLPVDLYISGCPPHSLTILDGMLRLLGRL